MLNPTYYEKAIIELIKNKFKLDALSSDNETLIFYEDIKLNDKSNVVRTGTILIEQSSKNKIVSVFDFEVESDFEGTVHNSKVELIDEHKLDFDFKNQSL